MSDRKPWTEGSVRETFVRGREQQTDFRGINNSRSEFELWLAEMKAAAWDEGYDHGTSWSPAAETYPERTDNPYRRGNR